MDVLLPLLWDHKRLGAEASRPFVFSPDSPVLKVRRSCPAAALLFLEVREFHGRAFWGASWLPA
jgi:hypothetical protein